MHFCTLLVSLLLVFESHFFISVSGICCPSYAIPLCKRDQCDSGYHGYDFCLDCTRAGPWQHCSSYGICNIFACNCDGECRNGICSLPCPTCSGNLTQNGTSTNHTNNAGALPQPMFTLDTIIQEADKDGDGLLNMDEAFKWVSKRNKSPKVDIILKLKLLDKNKDGLLSRSEIDG